MSPSLMPILSEIVWHFNRSIAIAMNDSIITPNTGARFEG
jgi:hypothetical protein